MFVRTCQECGHRQEAKDPKTYSSDAWRNLKCRKCKSEALDYGSDGFERTVDGKIVRKNEVG